MMSAIGAESKKALERSKGNAFQGKYSGKVFSQPEDVELRLLGKWRAFCLELPAYTGDEEMSS